MKLFGYYLLSPGTAVLPLAMSLVGVNYKGSTKKMTMTAILFLAYCAGNIAGPQFFKEDEAPKYQTAFRAIMVCYCLVLGIVGLLRVYLVWENRRKEKTEGELIEVEGEEELTDRNMPRFRYWM